MSRHVSSGQEKNGQFFINFLLFYYRALSKFSAVGSGSTSENASPDQMCNSMKGSLIKRQVISLFFFYNIVRAFVIMGSMGSLEPIEFWKYT